MSINLAQEISASCRDPGKAAYIFNDKPYSFAQLFEQAAATAGWLNDSGLRPGERILLALYDTPAIAVVFLAALRLGVVPIVINPRLTAGAFAHILRDSEAALAVCEFDNQPAISEAITTVRAEQPGTSRRGMLLQDLWPSSGEPLDDDIPELSQACRSAPCNSYYPTRADEAAFWQYTSGTTGQPKAVQHSSLTMLRNAQCFAFELHRLGSKDIFYSSAKMFFGYGMGASFFFPLLLGATALLDAQMPSNVVTVLRNLLQYKPSVFFGSPAIFAALLPHAERLKPLAEARTCFVSAGSSLPAALFESWQRAMGCPIYDGVGATEMGHIFLSNCATSLKAGTAGKPVPGYEVRVQKHSDETSGELWVKGPHPHLGYWRRDQDNERKFVDGWYATGDLFEVDSEGFFVHQGRADDLFKSNGIWVVPQPIENALMASVSCITECALVACRDGMGLETPTLFCAVAPDSGDQAQIRAQAQAALASICAKHEMPRKVIILDALPRNDNGKVSRKALQPLYLSLAATNA